MSNKIKKVLGIMLAVLLALGITMGFTFIGVVYGGYSFGISLLIPFGAYIIVAILGALVWLICELLNH